MKGLVAGSYWSRSCRQKEGIGLEVTICDEGRGVLIKQDLHSFKTEFPYSF